MTAPADSTDPAVAVERVRAIVARLPDADEEPAWVGVRWRVRGRTFAHVLEVVDGRPAKLSATAGTRGPAVVVTFRSAGDELDALAAIGPPYFTAHWGRDVAGVVLGDATDWDEIAELVTESYCLLAPRRLVALVERPESTDGSDDVAPR